MNIQTHLVCSGGLCSTRDPSRVHRGEPRSRLCGIKISGKCPPSCPRICRPTVFTWKTRGLELQRRSVYGQSSSNGTGSTVLDPPSANGSSIPSGPGLLMATGTEGAWDEDGVGSPVVRCYSGDDEQRWIMWYTGRNRGSPKFDAVFPSSGSIGIAASSDGIHWQRGFMQISGERGAGKDVGEVLGPNKDWWWHDTCHLAVGDVQIFSNASVSTGVGVYWMFYTGGDFEAIPTPSSIPGLPQQEAIEGLRMRAGLAMSQDGRNWARIESDHHTGALLDVGEPGEWDALFIGSPKVVAAGPRDMRMYYHSFDQQKEKWVVGLATSDDGFRWVKQGPMFEGSMDPNGFDGKGAAACHVIKDTELKQYVMFYESVGPDESRAIGMAVSKDGMKNWKRCSTPVLQPASNGWDEGSVGSPCAVAMAGGKWRLYYAGRSSRAKGHWSGIGLATSDGSGGSFEGMPVGFKRREG